MKKESDDSMGLLLQTTERNEKMSNISADDEEHVRTFKAGGGSSLNMRDFFFKCYVITLTIFVWTGYTLFVAHSRQTTSKSEVFFNDLVILCICPYFSHLSYILHLQVYNYNKFIIR